MGMKEPELKTCPFCGGPGEYVKDSEGPIYDYYVRCADCFAEVQLGTGKEGAALIWNTRAGERS